MKAKTLIIILAVTLFALLIIRSFHSSREAETAISSAEADAEKQTNGTSDPLQQNKLRSEQAKERTEQGTSPNLNRPFELHPSGSNMQEQLEVLARDRGVSLQVLTQQLATVWSNEWAGKLDGPIEFYGKVVDENGSPLNGASATINCRFFPEKQFKTNIYSDANGFFELQNLVGQGLMVNVRKDGYKEVPGTNEHSFLYHGVANGFHADANKPIIFRLRKR